MKIDDSWYEKPTGAIKQRTAAGGIIVRCDSTKTVWIGLTTGESEADSAYILPKGGVDPGEEIEQAAQREIEEEAGFSQLRLLGALGSRERLNFTKSRWVTTHYFLYETDETAPKPTDPNYAYRTDWFDLSQPLPEVFWPEQRALIEENKASILARYGVQL